MGFRKPFLAILLSVAVALPSRSDVLYWMVDETAAGDVGTFGYATVRAYTGDNPQQGEYLPLVLQDSKTGDYYDSGITQFPKSVFDGEGVYAGLDKLSGWQNNKGSYSFLVELWLDSGEKVAVGTSAAYAALHGETATSIVLSGEIVKPGDLRAWDGGSFTPYSVPEPTSGLMVLLGMALLALRRKRT